MEKIQPCIINNTDFGSIYYNNHNSNSWYPTLCTTILMFKFHFIFVYAPPPLPFSPPRCSLTLPCRASPTWSSKLFEASRKLIPAQDAIVFPTMEASSLAGGADVEFPSRLKGRVTLVGLFHRQFGYNMLPTWTEPFEKAFGVPGECQ